MPNQIQKIIEEFDEKFTNTFFIAKGGFFSERNGYDQHREIKSFVKQALLSLLSQEIQELEEMKREKVSGGFEGENEMNIEISCYNDALSDLITKKKQLISELEK